MILLNAPVPSSLTQQPAFLSAGGAALVLLLAAVKCISLMRRPTASRLCMVALLAAVLALLGAAGLVMVILWNPATSFSARTLGVTATGVLGMAAFVLGIIGLATYEKKRHTQGVGQAIASITIGMMVTLVVLVTAISRVIQTGQKTNAIVNVTDAAAGYETHLNTKLWKKWPDHKQPLVDFAALRTHEAVTVVALELGEEAPDIETMASAILRRWDIAYPSEDGQWTARPWTSPWGEGLEITGQREVDGTPCDYIFRVAVWENFVQVHGGWITRPSGSLTVLRQALDAITMRPPQPPPPAIPASKAVEFSLLCNDLGLIFFDQKDYSRAAHWFRNAATWGRTDPTYLTNAADAFRKAGEFKEGLEFLAPRITAFPKSFEAHVHHAYLLSETGEMEAASEAFLRAVNAGLKDEGATLSWLQHLNGKEHYALAEKAAEAWMKKHRNGNSRRWHAQTVGYAGDEKRSLALLEELSKELPDDKRVAYDLGEALNRAGEHAKAAAVAEKLLADGKKSPRATMMLGWSQMGRKWYREAKQTFEQMAATSPDDEDVQDALRQASAMLGQGNNSDIKTPVEAVALPASLLKLWKAHPAAPGHGAGQPYVWELTAKGYYFEPGKPARRTWCRKGRIQTTEGANSLSSIEYAFSPLYERIFINRVLVQDEEGHTLASAPGDAYVMDLEGNATHRKKLHFHIPALRPGCVVEFEVSIEDRDPATTFDFERDQFGNSAADIVFITGAVDEVAFSLTGAGKDALHTVKEKGLLGWAGFNLPYDREEPLSGLYEDRVPNLCLGGKGGSWKEIGAGFLKDLEDRLKLEDPVKALAEKLTAGLQEPRDKIAALSRHVQKEVSYTAIEFGTRARRPNNAAQTLQQQYGDCKDQALLLHQLLKAAGIESHLALVNNLWRTQPGLPTLDQFNHMVVHVPSLGEDWLIDPTDKNLPGHLWRADGLWHSHAFILEPGRPWLAPPVPTPHKDSSRVESRRSVTPGDDDAWHVDETFVLHGYYAAWMRGAFTGLDAAGQLRKVQETLQTNGRVQVHSFAFEDLADISKPARMIISYDVFGRLHAEDGMMRATLPALWENEYLETTYMKDRQTPFRFRYPFSFRSDVTITHLPGLTPASAKALGGGVEGEFSRWQMTPSTKNDAIQVHFEFDCVPGQHPAASYPKWHAEWSAALRCWDRPVVWKPLGRAGG